MVVVETNRKSIKILFQRIGMINKHTVVVAGRDTGTSRNIEYSSLLNDGIVVLMRGGGRLNVVAGGGGLNVVAGGGVD